MYTNSKIILGTVQFGLNYGINNSLGKPNQDKVFEILDFAAQHGIQTLDTANAYGDSEFVIGEYLKTQIKSPFKICSKFHEVLNLKEVVESTLIRLNTPQLFSFSFHNYACYQLISDNQLQELIGYKKTNVIKNIGVSIYTNEQLEDVINCDWIDIIQLPFNLLDCDEKKINLLKQAKSRNKIIHTRSVFLQGLFYKNANELPNKLIPLKPYLQKIDEIALEHKMSKNELALSFTINKNYIDNVLIGVDTIEQLKNNINNISTLDDKIVTQIQSIKVIEKELLNPANWN